MIKFEFEKLGINKESVKNAKIQLHVSRYDLASSQGLENTSRKLWIYNVGDMEADPIQAEISQVEMDQIRMEL